MSTMPTAGMRQPSPTNLACSHVPMPPMPLLAKAMIIAIANTLRRIEASDSIHSRAAPLTLTLAWNMSSPAAKSSPIRIHGAGEP
jgi:hypothetical protein